MKYMTRVLLPVAAVLISSSAWAESKFDLGVGVEQFRWREYDSSGAQLLEEKGPRFVLHGHTEDWQSSGAIFTAQTDLYIGKVDYDGQTQLGTPLKTDTNYAGVALEGGAGYLWPAGRHGIGFIGSLGADYWIRSLQDAYTSGGAYVNGYDEKWLSFYARLAAAWNYRAGGWKQRLRAGLKYPLYTQNDIPDLGVTLQPEGATSYFASWETHWSASQTLSMGLAIYHEDTRYRVSDPEQAGSVSYYQPESRQWVTGARFQMMF